MLGVTIIMPIFLYLELNFFAIAILFVIALNMRRQGSRYLFDQKLFLMLLSVCTLLLALDSWMRVLNGKPGEHITLLYTLAIVVYNILNPIICMIWYYYVDYYVYGDKARITKILFPLFLPVAINAVLSVASIFSNIYFIFDENNLYDQGRFIYILLGICLYIIMYTAVFLIKNRQKITQKEFFYFIFFAIPPSLGGILQVIVSGINIIWITATLSILIIFINIQKEQLHTDYLTGVNNRRYLDTFLHTIIRNKGCGLIAGIMIDIDSFKMINDVYGHDQGDEALKHTAQLLRDTFRKTDFIARYGGDEFVVIMEINVQSELTAMVQRLKENVSQFNLKKLAPYEINLSMGYDYQVKESKLSTGELLKRIDYLMYLDKQKIHTFTK
ncbi:MAG: GGDEF domain-containing protein [Clostridia bacterium]|jgi:diguanylate cyclase (GGDEF)-like protein|nr:GGDEF domain-containing protein [Clostridia bacterium]